MSQPLNRFLSYTHLVFIHGRPSQSVRGAHEKTARSQNDRVVESRTNAGEGDFWFETLAFLRIKH